MKNRPLASLAFQCMLQSSLKNSLFDRKIVELMSIISNQREESAAKFIRTGELKLFLIRFLEDVARLKITNQKARMEVLARECDSSMDETVQALELVAAIAEMLIDDDVKKALNKAVKALGENAKEAIQSIDMASA